MSGKYITSLENTFTSMEIHHQSGALIALGACMTHPEIESAVLVGEMNKI
jgi:hypothetical protein